MSFRIFICLSPTNQGIQGTGIALIPMALVFVLVSPLSGLLTGKVGSRLMTAGGAAVIGCGLLLIAPTATVRVDDWRRDRPCPDGARDGPCHRALMGAAVGAVAAARSGTAAALINVARMAGASIGVAILGAVFAMAHGGAEGLRVPVSQGFVANLARPSRNVTGFTTFEPTMGSKWLEVLKEVAPRITRVASCSTRTRLS